MQLKVFDNSVTCLGPITALNVPTVTELTTSYSNRESSGPAKSEYTGISYSHLLRFNWMIVVKSLHPQRNTMKLRLKCGFHLPLFSKVQPTLVKLTSKRSSATLSI